MSCVPSLFRQAHCMMSLMALLMTHEHGMLQIKYAIHTGEEICILLNLYAMSLTGTQTWHRNGYFITTDPSSVPLKQLNQIFSQADFSWGTPLSEPSLQTMINSSECFALFQTNVETQNKTSRLVGFGRWITDYVTVVYVNDIYIKEEHRGKGLAKWMFSCMDEHLKGMPDLRGTIMIVEKDTPTELLYKRHFAMEDLETPNILLDRKGPGSAS